jgi:imidazolonepropionase-like amidohydrolase
MKSMKFTKSMILICRSCALMGLITATTAPHAATIAIIHARLETMTEAGPIASGTLIMQDGNIIAVGESARVPEGAQTIDVQGAVVTPGLIAPSTNVMVDEVNLLSETRDDWSGNQLSAGFDVQYGINPASTLVRVGRQSGVTSAVITPLAGRMSLGADDDHEVASLEGGGDGSGNTDPPLFAGQAAIVRLSDNDPDPLVKARVAVALDLGEAGASQAGGSRGAAIVFVKSALADARRFAASRAAYDRGEVRSYGLSKLDLEALVPVVKGATPLLIRVHRASDIRESLRLAREEKVRVILEGAEEGWMVADDIAQAKVPVLIDPQDDLPEAFESLAARLDNAARLNRAGVTLAIKAKRDFNSLRPIRLNAGTAVAYGLPYEAALAAITINPARLWGIADRVGALKPGLQADLVIWSGDPLETTSYPKAVFIRGVQQADTSRRLELRDRYMKAADGYPPAYH